MVIIPSAREINHIYPLPQPAYPGKEFIRLSNPSTFRVNDITIGSVNADVIKELTLSTVTKEIKTPKVDLAWRSILEQKTYYPVYPANPNTPIEWSQYKHMMFPEGVVPDLLLIPSDLMLLAKSIEGCICVNPGMLVKGQAPGTYANITIDPFTSNAVGQAQSNKAAQRVRVDILNI